MKMYQSGVRGRNFSLYKPISPFLGGAHFLLLFLLAWAVTWSCFTGAVASELQPWGCNAWAATFSCFAWVLTWIKSFHLNKVSSFIAPQLGDSGWLTWWEQLFVNITDVPTLQTPSHLRGFPLLFFLLVMLISRPSQLPLSKHSYLNSYINYLVEAAFTHAKSLSICFFCLFQNTSQYQKLFFHTFVISFSLSKVKKPCFLGMCADFLFLSKHSQYNYDTGIWCLIANTKRLDGSGTSIGQLSRGRIRSTLIT